MRALFAGLLVVTLLTACESAGDATVPDSTSTPTTADTGSPAAHSAESPAPTATAQPPSASEPPAHVPDASFPPETTSRIPTPAPTPTPELIDHTDYGLPVWDAPPKTGVAHVDAIIAAIASADAAALRPYITGILAKCDHHINDRGCLPNTPDGTLTRYVASYGCDGAWVPITEELAASFARSVSRAGRVVAAWARRPGDPDDRRYVIAFTTQPRLLSGGGTEIEINDQGIIGVGRVFVCNTSKTYVDGKKAQNYDALIPIASER
jgi:hypothetical protein